MAESVTLDFLAQQQARILNELAEVRTEMRSLRNDMDMLIRMVVRLDRTVDAMREDIRTLWLDQGSLRQRIEALEARDK
jgi:uncharacterized coiled-coil DUF342 family protein